LATLGYTFPTYRAFNAAIPGSVYNTGNQIQSITTRQPYVFPQFSASRHYNILILGAPTNDIAAGTSAAATLALVKAYALAAKALPGCNVKVLVDTCISRTGFDSQVAAYNVALKADPNSPVWYDGIIDQGNATIPAGTTTFTVNSVTFHAGDPNPMGAGTGGYSNTTYYKVDGIHPTQPVGDQVMAGMAVNPIQNLINSY
jgi:hypothetical protein